MWSNAHWKMHHDPVHAALLEQSKSTLRRFWRAVCTKLYPSFNLSRNFTSTLITFRYLYTVKDHCMFGTRRN